MDSNYSCLLNKKRTIFITWKKFFKILTKVELKLMKKLRLHLYIILGFFVATFIIGAFLDQQISQGLFHRDDTFGLLVSVVGTLPGYLLLSFVGGGFLSIALKKQYKIGWTIVFYVLCAACVGLTIFFAGREFFGPNGFYNPSIKWVGYIIVVPFAMGMTYLGYYLINKSERKGIWIILVISAFFIFMALVPGVTLLKSVFHRPRYRSLTLYDEITFHNWYQACRNYKDLMASTGLTSEEFKSFPSGHAGASALTIMFALLIPYFVKDQDKIQLPLFYAGFGWVLLVSFSRILVGAHFMSDVSMGAILTIAMIICANECIIYATKRLESN